MALIGCKEVMDVLCVKKSTAYQVIQKLNEELQEQGYMTIRGKVEEYYLKERYKLND